MSLQMACSLRPHALARAAVRPCFFSKSVKPVVCQAQKEEPSPIISITVPLISMVAASFLLSSAFPLDAIASNRSGGRVGGGFSRSASRSYSSPGISSKAPAPRTTVNNTTVYSSPSVVAVPIITPAPVFGYSSYGFMPTFIPFPFFGGLFQFMFLALIASAVFNVIRGFLKGQNRSNKSDDWGEL